MTVKSFIVQVPGDNAINVFVLCQWHFAIISVFPCQVWPEDWGKCAQILNKVAKAVAKPKMLILLSKTSTSNYFYSIKISKKPFFETVF